MFVRSAYKTGKELMTNLVRNMSEGHWQKETKDMFNALCLSNTIINPAWVKKVNEYSQKFEISELELMETQKEDTFCAWLSFSIHDKWFNGIHIYGNKEKSATNEEVLEDLKRLLNLNLIPVGICDYQQTSVILENEDDVNCGVVSNVVYEFTTNDCWVSAYH